MPTGTVAVTPRAVASMRVTVATLAFKTQTDPSPTPIAIGYGASAPGRLTIWTRSVTRRVRGSMRDTVAARPEMVQMAPSPTATPLSEWPASIPPSTRLVRGSTRTRRLEPSVTQTPPRPAAIDHGLSRIERSSDG
jgi:hypothetical protein